MTTSYTYTHIVPPPHNPDYNDCKVATLIGLVSNKNLSQIMKTNYPTLIPQAPLDSTNQNVVDLVLDNSDSVSRRIPYGKGDVSVPVSDYPLLMKQYRRIIPLKSANTISTDFSAAQVGIVPKAELLRLYSGGASGVIETTKLDDQNDPNSATTPDPTNTTTPPQQQPQIEPSATVTTTTMDIPSTTTLDPNQHSFIILGPLSHFLQNPNDLSTLPLISCLTFLLPVINFAHCDDLYQWEFHRTMWPLTFNPKEPDSTKSKPDQFSPLDHFVQKTLLDILILDSNQRSGMMPMLGHGAGVKDVVQGLGRIGSPHFGLVFDTPTFLADLEEMVGDLQAQQSLALLAENHLRQERQEQQQQPSSSSSTATTETKVDNPQAHAQPTTTTPALTNSQDNSHRKQLHQPKSKTKPPNPLDYPELLAALIYKSILAIAYDACEDTCVEFTDTTAEQCPTTSTTITATPPATTPLFLGSQFSQLPITTQLETLDQLPVAVQHVTMQCAQQCSAVAGARAEAMNYQIGSHKAMVASTIQHLCNDYDLYLTHEPCNMCAMGAVHSRFKRIFFIHTIPNGALTTQFAIQELAGINHRYEVYRVGVK